MFEHSLNCHPDPIACGEDRRAYQGCPTIAVTKGGRLYAGWYTGGIFEPDTENYNLLVKSDDRGESWSEPLITIGTDRVHCARAIDIQLFVDKNNVLYVFFTQDDYRPDTPEMTYDTSLEKLLYYFNQNPRFGVWVCVCRNPDDETPRFEAPRRVCDGFLRCKPVELSDGRILVPAYNWAEEAYYVYGETRDSFETVKMCRAVPKPQNRVFDETVLCETAPGELLLLARTNLGYFAMGRSHDGGKTWGETGEFEKAPSSRLYFGKLSDGGFLYVRNSSDTQRRGMKAVLFNTAIEKEGELELDTRADVSYPDAAELDGYYYIVHDRERDNRMHGDRKTGQSGAAKEILLSKISRRDLAEGRLHEGSYTARILSKGKDNSFIREE